MNLGSLSMTTFKELRMGLESSLKEIFRVTVSDILDTVERSLSEHQRKMQRIEFENADLRRMLFQRNNSESPPADTGDNEEAMTYTSYTTTPQNTIKIEEITVDPGLNVKTEPGLESSHATDLPKSPAPVQLTRRSMKPGVPGGDHGGSDVTDGSHETHTPQPPSSDLQQDCGGGREEDPIRRVTMATGKRRATFFTPLELRLLMRSYGEFEHVFRRKCNTAAAAKRRETAWENIAARVNACNPAGEKRTWQQLKMKYKNIVQTANRKKADARKTGGGPAPPPLTEAEELALSQHLGRPGAEGIPGGSSSSELTPQDTSAFIKYSDGAICLVEPPHATTDLVTDEEYEESVSAAFTEGDPERPIEGMAGQQQEGPSTSTAQIDTLPVKEIYKIYQLKKIQKTDKEMQYLDRQIRRADLEIELLEHKLEEIKKTK